MPGVYTIKTILATLDRDLDNLKENAPFETKVKEAMLLQVDKTKLVSFFITNLHTGWITGILSMIVLIFEFVDDFYYIA